MTMVNAHGRYIVYPAVHYRIDTTNSYIVVSCYGICIRLESLYAITWAFCIVRLFQLWAMRRPSSGGMGKEESHVSIL